MVGVSQCSPGGAAVFPCLKGVLLAQVQLFWPPELIVLFLQSSFPADQPSRVYQYGILYLSLGTGLAIFCTSLNSHLLFVWAFNIFLNGSTAIWASTNSPRVHSVLSFRSVLKVSNSIGPLYRPPELVTGLHLYFRPLTRALGAQLFKQPGHLPHPHLACTLSLM